MVIFILRREKMLLDKEDIGKVFFIETKTKEIRGGRIIGGVEEVNGNYIKLSWEYPYYRYEINQKDILYASEVDLVITDILDERRNEEMTKEEWDAMVKGLKYELYKFYYYETEPSEVDLNRKLKIVFYYIKYRYKPSIIHIYLEGTPPKGELFIFENGEVMLLGNRRYKICYELPKEFEKYYKIISAEVERLKEVTRWKDKIINQIMKETGKEDVRNISVKQLYIVIQNIQDTLKRKLTFWLERKGDKVYLCWR
jgi:hypothetical protein